MRSASRQRRFGSHSHQRSIDRPTTGGEAGLPAWTTASARAKAIRMLVKALVVWHPGQPVTVTFAEGSSPVLTVHAAVGFPEGMHSGSSYGHDERAVPSRPGTRHSSGTATGRLRIVDRLTRVLVLQALRAYAHQ